MSNVDDNHQVQEILKRLDEQDRLAEERLNAQYKIYQAHAEGMRELTRKIEEVNTKTDKMYRIFNGVTFSADLFIALCKAILLIGGVVGVAYGLIKWLKE